MKIVENLKLRTRFKVVFLIIIMESLILLEGCAVVNMAAENNNRTPHQEFIIIWGRFMGHPITMVNAFAAESRFLVNKKLPNGNIENSYNAHLKGRGDSCVVYYEYNSETGIIVNWRYEGNDASCVWYGGP